MGQQETKVMQIQKMVALQQEIEKTKREMDYIAETMERAKRQEHIRRLLRAGSILEEAGILQTYDKNLLYLLPVMNKEFLCNKDYAVSGKNRFDLVHGLKGLDMQEGENADEKEF